MNAAKNDGSDGGVSTEMRSLLERRSTLQNWLANLDNLGSRYRPEVADRVRTDYQARLEDLATELEGHRGAIESALADRRVVKAELDGRFDSKSAEIEETELRFQIGEFDESTWASQRDEHASHLEDIKAELEIALDAVVEMEKVLAELAGTDSPTTPVEPTPKPNLVQDPAPEPEPEAEPEPELAPVTDPEPELVIELVADAGPTDGAASGDDILDELEFLESLSLDDADSFDAVSRMLEDEETPENGSSG
jgi:hypothetical protein